MKYQTLIDVYTAILKGDIDVSESLVNVDGGTFTIYEAGKEIFECSEYDALTFIADLFQMTWQES